MNKHKISLITALLLTGSLNADMDSYMKGLIDSAPARAYRSESVIGYSGGDLRLRYGTTGQIKTPINIQAPKLAIGCGGIDASLGGFAYLKDEMVQTMQNISAAAPAFAFQLALKTLCSQCAATIDELKALADQINGMALDTCSTSNKMVGMAQAALQANGVLDDPNKKTQGWLSQSISNPVNTALGNVVGPVKEFINTSKSYLSKFGASDDETKQALQPLSGSWLASALTATQNAEKLNLDNVLGGADSIALMRAMVGDVYGWTDLNEGPMYKHIPATWTPGDVKRFIGVDNAGGEAFLITKVTDNTKDENGIYTSLADIDTSGSVSFSGMKKVYQDKITPVLMKLGLPSQTITASELQGIQQLPVPIYKILQNEVLAKGYNNADIDTLSEYIASVEAVALIQKTVGSAQKFLASKKLAHGTFIANGQESELNDNQLKEGMFQALYQNIAGINMVVNYEYSHASQKYKDKAESIVKQRQIERQIRAQLAKTSLFQKSTLSTVP